MGIIKIKSIHKIENADVYNMEVANTHCFATSYSDVITHNCDAMRYLVNRMKDKNKIANAAKNIGI